MISQERILDLAYIGALNIWSERNDKLIASNDDFAEAMAKKAWKDLKEIAALLRAEELKNSKGERS